MYFDRGAIFSFLPETLKAISSLPTEILATVELTPSGKGLRWDKPDIDLSIQGLLLGIFDRARSLRISSTADEQNSTVTN